MNIGRDCVGIVADRDPISSYLFTEDLRRPPRPDDPSGPSSPVRIFRAGNPVGTRDEGAAWRVEPVG